MQLIKKIFYYTNKLFYYIMILFYVSITISIVYFDIVDVEGDFREIICSPAIITFVVLYILTVELPAAVFKVKVERYDMFSKKYDRTIMSILLDIIIVLFIIETIVIAVITKQIMYYDVFTVLALLFFRVAIRM
ncbi:MAG: hypothetical protein ACM67R_01685, partial [Clostridiales bacterium]